MIWYEEDVQQAEKRATELAYTPKTIFYGSSSIRLWPDLYSEFKNNAPLNLGFGGSTITACDFFLERLFKPFQPSHIVFYAGDNDLGDGKSEEEVFASFEHLLVHVSELFPEASFSFISIKPSISRWAIVDQIRYTNQLIKNRLECAGKNRFYVSIFEAMLNKSGIPEPMLFEPDGLHLSKKGYEVWNKILRLHVAAKLKIK